MRKAVSEKALSIKDIGKHSANAKNSKNGVNWRDNNPNSKEYIKNKPIEYLDIDKKFRDLKKGAEDKILVSGTLDNSNKKITLKLKDDTKIDTDVKPIYDEIDKKIDIPTNANENNIAIFTDTKEVKDSNITISDNGSTLTLKDSTIIKNEGVEINQNGSGDRYAYIDFHSDDDNDDYSARIIRNKGKDSNLEIQLIGTGDIVTSFDNGKIFEHGGLIPIVGSDNSDYAGNKNTIATLSSLDDLLKTGVYNYSADDIAGSPINGWCYITVKIHSNKNSNGKWVTQEVESMGANNLTGIRYIRNKVNGTWDNWTPITLNKEIPIQYLSDLVSYENDWEDYNSNWRPTIVKKSNGLVVLNGLIKNGDNDTKLCKLPAEFKPNNGANSIMGIVMCSASHYARFDVTKDGDIYIAKYGEGTRDDTNWVSINFTYQATPI